MTRTQKATVILLIIYFLYEYFLMRPWSSGSDVIRVDLLLIVPFLSFFIIKSIVQIFTRKKKQTEEMISVDHGQKVTISNNLKEEKVKTESGKRVMQGRKEKTAMIKETKK
ncbi:hypothetical protein [Pollutibacter soli]|uniref:hypothetical protein n=1 Tax=Pollutibacter soli TaxID=3034157 RepID=UPI003013B035